MNFIERIARRVFIWCLVRRTRGLDSPVSLQQLIEREMDAILENAAAFAANHKSEVQILKERLGRRYDLGLALNEAANRALTDKAALEHDDNPPPVLTRNQEAALRFQKDYLQRIVSRQ